MSDSLKEIAILVSGGGTNLQSIIDNINSGFLRCRIKCIIGDRPLIYAEKRAEIANIPYILIDRKIYKDELSDKILEEIGYDLDLIVNAGFLSILKGKILEIYKKKIINIHPALLPKYGGKGMFGINVHKAVIENKEKISGCCIHYVDSGIDSGEIIDKIIVPVEDGETPETLQKRVLEQEHILLPKVIKLLLE